jgi:L-ascorbate metabolism protein UlaG (beta-lactamase superfamily)
MTPGLRADVTFIGNATTLLRLGDFTLLTDPAYGPAGSRVSLGYGMWTRRLHEPALDRLAGVTPDAVLLSHLHGDHFDRAARRALAPDLPILTTPQAERRLRRGFPGVVGLPVWESHEWTRGTQRLRVTAVPGQHGPGLADKLLPDVMGSVIQLADAGRELLTIYVTGDTLFRPGLLAEIPRRFGEIDAMLIHLGGTRVLGLLVTMDDRQGVELGHLIRAGRVLPIHYDDYRVFTSPLSAFLDRARREGLAGVQPMIRGVTARLE